ncbi:MAG: hypothetical protein JW849_07155 [Phycisphaerae bacterium]|nr:hypothetical protein [Phycisphaerae bacterium]
MRLETVVYRAAGKGVVSLILGYTFKSITILCIEEVPQIVLKNSGWRGSEVPHTENRPIEGLCIHFAGILAASKFMKNKSYYESTNGDIEELEELENKTVFTEEMRKEAWKKAEIFIDKYWIAISRVAEILLIHWSIDRKTIKKFLSFHSE